MLPANRRPITITTADGLNLIGEVATPIGNRVASILCLHPLPTAGGMMDSHVYKKVANRLPAMAGIEVVPRVLNRMISMSAIAGNLFAAFL